MPAKAKGQYRVLNPRGIPEGRWIIRFKKGEFDQRWHEGDVFDPPAGMDIKRMLRDGFIEEVKVG